MASMEYDVVIKGVENGIIVQVGCKTFVGRTDDIDEMLADVKVFVTEGRSGLRKLREKWLGEEKAKEECCVDPAPGLVGAMSGRG